MSVHTLNPLHLGKMMHPVKSAEWGARALAAQMRLVQKLHNIITIKINTCVDVDENDALSVAELAKQYGLSWRAMNVLENTEASYAALERMCATLRATAMEAVLIRGSSSCSVSMRCTNGFDFKVKLIRENYLPHMCTGCDIRESGLCTEFFYGPRVEVSNDSLMVRSCIHRNGEPFVQLADRFFSGPLCKDVKNATS